MNHFQLSPQADPNKIFLTKFSALEGRFDPHFYKPEFQIIIQNINTGNNNDLGNVVNFSNEVWNQKDLFDNLFPYIEIGAIDILTGDIKNINNILVEEAPSRAKMLVLKEDILISTTRPSRGAISLFNKDGVHIASTGFSIIRGVNANILSKKFLFYLLRLKISLKQMEQRSSGGNYPAITQEELAKIKIPIPPKNIQDEIVAIMDKVYQNKQDKEAKAQQLLASIDDYLLTELGIDLPKQTDNSLKSRIFTKKFSEIAGGRFDCEYYQNKYIDYENILIKTKNYTLLKELLQMLESGSRPTGGVGNIANGILSFGGTHVTNDGYISTKKAKYIPVEYHQKNLATATKINDLLLVKDGATTGKIAIIQKSKHESQNINEHVFLMRLKNNVNPIYLLSYLKSSFGNTQIKRDITGATVTGLTKDVVNNLKIPLPPLTKQNQIAEHISQIRQQAKQLQLEVKTELAQAKKQVEQMILGD